MYVLKNHQQSCIKEFPLGASIPNISLPSILEDFEGEPDLQRVLNVPLRELAMLSKLTHACRTGNQATTMTFSGSRDG